MSVSHIKTIYLQSIILSVEVKCQDISSTPVQKIFFWRLCLAKTKKRFYQGIVAKFRHNSKKIEGGLSLKIFRTKLFSLKTMSNLGVLTDLLFTTSSNNVK
jgi:hypothetical protein